MSRHAAVMPYVLMYHSVEEYESDPLLITVSPRRFAAQMSWLRRSGLRGVSMRDLLAAEASGRARGMVGLTFDDGYADFATEAVPILVRYGFTATVFAVAGHLGGHNVWDPDGPRKPLMTAQQLREVDAAGMEVASHTVNHTFLEMADDAGLELELKESRMVLEDVLDRDVTGFAYPYGLAGAREVDAVRAAGYSYACAIWKSEHSGRHALARTYVGDRDGALRMRAKRIRHRLRWGRSR
ncbi:polysaccharide deacetylase [Planobispora rosea]|uniref:Polysaccharide deacetylase n=1 Tax=Planobispora rosea TaxID=35762 RepID=A0A8J3S318_PLARO|nr:polysaccharide deacetylase family protein [Planobispora rosea]GGS79560.1 polysaccharide deacetylase [Planobispora rosea]GIH85859.1 polysaccharide deacetylase [Planobispora rosea]